MAANSCKYIIDNLPQLGQRTGHLQVLGLLCVNARSRVLRLLYLHDQVIVVGLLGAHEVVPHFFPSELQRSKQRLELILSMLDLFLCVFEHILIRTFSALDKLHHFL